MFNFFKLETHPRLEKLEVNDSLNFTAWLMIGLWGFLYVASSLSL